MITDVKQNMRKHCKPWKCVNHHLYTQFLQLSKFCRHITMEWSV